MTLTHRVVLAPAAAALLLLAGSAAFAETAKDLVGPWQLVSNVVTKADGSKTDQFGPNPHGLIYFEANGHYVLSIIRDGLPKIAGKGREHTTPEEASTIIAGSISHFGTYEVEGDKIVFHVAYATFPNWDGTTSKRPFKIKGDELQFFVPSASAGAGSSSVVTLKRQK